MEDEPRPTDQRETQISDLVEVLANERRRYVLYFLQNEERAEFEEVLDQITAWETNAPSEHLEERRKRDVRTDLYHVHLPKLEDAGIIGYDRRHGSICFRYPSDSIKQFLDYCAAIELPEMNCR